MSLIPTLIPENTTLCTLSPVCLHQEKQIKGVKSMTDQIKETREILAEDCSQLFSEFLGGSIDAFSRLYDVYVNMLFNYGCKLTSDRELLKDCIHDVFVKIYNKRDDLSNVINIRSYLFVSLRNRLFDELRKKSFVVEKQAEEHHPVASENVELDYINREKSGFDYNMVSRLLNKLSVRQREAITLYYLEERKYEDICSIMDINYQSLRNLIHRGMTKLREVAI